MIDVTVYALWGLDENGNGVADVLENKALLVFRVVCLLYTSLQKPKPLKSLLPVCRQAALLRLAAILPTHRLQTQQVNRLRAKMCIRDRHE